MDRSDYTRMQGLKEQRGNEVVEEKAQGVWLMCITRGQVKLRCYIILSSDLFSLSQTLEQNLPSQKRIPG